MRLASPVLWILSTALLLVCACQSHDSFQVGPHLVAGRPYHQEGIDLLVIGETSRRDAHEFLGKPFLVSAYPPEKPLREDRRNLHDPILPVGRHIGRGEHNNLSHGKKAGTSFQHGQAYRPPKLGPGDREAWVYYERWQNPYYEHSWTGKRVAWGEEKVRERGLVLIFEDGILVEIREGPPSDEPPLNRPLATGFHPHEVYR